MRGKFYLVLLVALFTVFAGANILADRYNQLTGNNIPEAIEVKNNPSAYGVEIFGDPYNMDKSKLDNLFTMIKTELPDKGEKLSQWGHGVAEDLQDIFNRAADYIKGLTGQKEEDYNPDKGDLV